MSAESFFAFAHERHSIYLRRRSGKPHPWTDDPILQKYRFTNVYRELDATTVWFRENVRDRLANSPNALLATVLFRWFNRIRTGEAIFCQKSLDIPQYNSEPIPGCTPWSMILLDGVSVLGNVQNAIRAYCGKGPFVTGAYIIKTPDGFDKLAGVLECVRLFMTHVRTFPGYGMDLGYHQAAVRLMRDDVTLEDTWSWLRQFPFMGDFMAYEVVTDLVHTNLLCRAPDIMTWANPGPGATRGIGRVLHDNPDKFDQRRDKRLIIKMMRELLATSVAMGWVSSDGPAWTMREVEHTLCEFDKYERARLGQGKPKQVFRR